MRQPWAWAIVHGGKDVENRSRNLAGSYRGPVAIHAGLVEDEAAYYDEMIRDALGRCDDSWLLEEQLVAGAFVGVAHLWAVHQARPGCCPNRGARPYGSPWAQHDAVHLCLTSPRPLPEPIPARGRLGLWTPEPAVLEQLQAVTR